MVEADKMQMVIDLLGDDADEVSRSMIQAKLSEAHAAIMQRIWINYPSIPEHYKMPNLYDMLQCRLAVRYINRLGVEGEVIHDSNGTKRDYESVNDEDLLREVTQMVGL